MTHVRQSVVGVVIFSIFLDLTLQMQKNMLNSVNIEMGSASACILKELEVCGFDKIYHISVT